MADKNAIGDGQRNKSILKMELEALPSWGPTKTKGSWHKELA